MNDSQHRKWKIDMAYLAYPFAIAIVAFGSVLQLV
jgi:hypothetical protein